jgi:hypothetical protein
LQDSLDALLWQPPVSFWPVFALTSGSDTSVGPTLQQIPVSRTLPVSHLEMKRVGGGGIPNFITGLPLHYVMYSMSPSPGNQNVTLRYRRRIKDFLQVTIAVINSPSLPAPSSVRESRAQLYEYCMQFCGSSDDTTSDRHLSGLVFVFQSHLPPSCSTPSGLLSLEPLRIFSADFLSLTPFATGCTIIRSCHFCVCARKRALQVMP